MTRKLLRFGPEEAVAWVVYRMTSTASQFATLREREESLGRLTSLVRSLAGAPRLYGLCAQIDPGEVAARMMQGIDTQRHPGCAEVADARRARTRWDVADAERK